MTDFRTFDEIREGADVYGSDGEKVGSIVALRPNYLVVEKGFFFPTDYYIPRAAVASVQGGAVYLNVARDAALNQGWDAVPVDFDSEALATDATLTGAAATGAYAGAVPEHDFDTARAEAAGVMGAEAGAERETLETGETIAIPVHEEELVATKRRGEVGDVRVEKVVTSEEQAIDVPVTEERVRVERRAVDRPVTAADADLFREEVIEVPVYGEDVEVAKRVRVAEEVDIAKEAVQRTERVADTVRREDVRISGDNVNATTGEVADATKRAKGKRAKADRIDANLTDADRIDRAGRDAGI